MEDIPLRPTTAPRRVRTDIIVANPRNLRDGDLWDNDEQRDQMVVSMQEVGQISALVVCSRQEYDKRHPGYDLAPSAQYVILAGHRRHEAIRLAEIEETRIDLRDDQLPNADLLMIEENMKRKALSVLQEAEGYRRLEVDGDSHAAIAKKVGRSKSHITKRITLLKLPDDAKAALTAKTLTIDNAYNLFTAFGPEGVGLILPANDLLRSDRNLSVADAVNRLLLSSVATKTEQDSPVASEPVLPEPVPIAGARTSAAPGPSHTTQAGSARTGEPAAEPSAPTGTAVLPEPTPSGTSATFSPSVPTARTEPPTADAAETGNSAEKQRPFASAARDYFCAKLVGQHTQPVADAPATRIAETVLLQASAATLARVHGWMQRIEPAVVGELTPSGYRDTVLAQGDAARICRLAYATSLAESELRAANRTRNWDSRDVAYLNHLVASGYTPTPWDQQHLS
ncbi:ParB/RepB/Spo0J family partition protein [Streptomyces sp. NPDC056169]|uniref:ParB/RepB/Spo0J family partition protein n=1 Tax=Streptomyces sp. NPDC056169 TaxID=3345734 RepID=UPI0035E0DDCA